ncbi:type I secretion system permease/ATPase [Falsigemmobacter faecalis]|uniref:Type I secretion system permease/ATPase n=1 Tax=Falsigemmobacter faecalis TaxID=2488730 RepID=A0A3P3DJZ7_9RHOB|nr:type I secretion system permease/ATPase [Falsigemmobacter faecalis]RRH73912.1 type I secretion system permease/ATPase [Falsigemmobacter faecalis]
MREADSRTGLQELRAAQRGQRGLFVTVFFFTAMVNLLMLAGPVYMLQVYDRVLGSHSEATLVALSGLIVFLFSAMGLLDHLRGRIAARIGAVFQERLDGRVFLAAARLAAVFPGDALAQTAPRDLEAVQRLLISPALMALFDLPWAALFLLLLFVFHPLCGAFALCGGAVLICVTLLNERVTRLPLIRAAATAQHEEQLADQFRAEAATLRVLGMQANALHRWTEARRARTAAALQASDAGGGFGALTRTFRLLLQSLMLGLGAFLVLRDELTAGAMIAASILLGRALAPVEAVIGQWGVITHAREGHARLARLLTRVPKPTPRLPLPRPRAHLSVQNLTLAPPGEAAAVLRGLSFDLHPGQALGVIGPSGAGKSSLARALTGHWPAGAGRITLDAAPLAQFDSDRLGRLIGCLPQRVVLFEGTVAENIARLDPAPEPAAILRAAARAGAHEMILQLPQGYETRLSAAGAPLSGGQIQRIGLARALYDDPVLLVLDEPNSNLDAEGSGALNQAVRSVKEAGGAVLIMAHRPAAIQECDLLLVLEGGLCTAFGPRDQVLRAQVRNHTDLRSAVTGGAS